MLKNRAVQTAACLCFLLPVSLGCSTASQPEPMPSSDRVVVGQLQLPTGVGARGVQVIIEVATGAEATHHAWLILDEEHRFREAFTGTLKELEVVAGIDKTVFELNAEELARLTKKSQVEVGTIDLRERLQTRSFKLMTEAGSVTTVRIGMWFGVPPAGVSLGSRQFPEIESGTETSWLLPREFDTVYWLVEEPADERRGRHWMSGKQTLFGPFDSSELPTELTIK